MRSSVLSNERRQRLDELGFEWDPHESAWKEGYNHLTGYWNREGHCRVPQGHKEDGHPLGGWVREQRANADTLSDERRRLLDELGFVWEPHQKAWEQGLSYLKIYKDRAGHCKVSVHHKERGFPLGRWVSKQRGKVKSLSLEHRRCLDELGFIWSLLEGDWEEGFNYLRNYKDREGHCRVPAKYKENGFPLGQWVITQRSCADTISEERRKQLDNIGFIWDPREMDWEEGFSHLRSYRDREGHCRVPQSYMEHGYRLGQWVSVQRVRLNKITLSDEHRQRLDDLGFIWNVLEADWDEGFSYLKSYKDREGHCRVPTVYKENGFALGRWVSLQRSQKDDLTAERRQKLDDLGFVWNKRDYAWEVGFSHLRSYRDRVGHCRVPKDHKEDGYPLGQWVGKLRPWRADNGSSETLWAYWGQMVNLTSGYGTRVLFSPLHSRPATKRDRLTLSSDNQ
jgi:hypothetical protein